MYIYSEELSHFYSLDVKNGAKTKFYFALFIISRRFQSKIGQSIENSRKPNNDAAMSLLISYLKFLKIMSAFLKCLPFDFGFYGVSIA